MSLKVKNQMGLTALLKRWLRNIPSMTSGCLYWDICREGGSPSQFDRVFASQLGAAAVDALMDDQKSIMLGIMNKEIVHVPFNKTIKHTKNLNPELLNLVRILSI